METQVAILSLAALAQSTRLDAFRLLVKAEPEGLAAGDLARRLAVPPNTLSTHLAILTRAGLVQGTRQSRQIVYRAQLEAFKILAAFLLHDCCGGQPEICGPLLDVFNAAPAPPAACPDSHGMIPTQALHP